MAAAANAALVFEWQGEIDHLSEHRAGAASEGVYLGGAIAGRIQFDRSSYDSVSLIQGSYSGPRYTFTENFLMEFRIGSAVWRFSESNLFLQWVNTSGPTTQLFESHSTSNDFSFDSFPNYAGSFNVGRILTASEYRCAGRV
jgi:hypothetical protein